MISLTLGSTSLRSRTCKVIYKSVLEKSGYIYITEAGQSNSPDGPAV